LHFPFWNRSNVTYSSYCSRYPQCFWTKAQSKRPITSIRATLQCLFFIKRTKNLKTVEPLLK
jgi:hypothetical protein